MGEQIQDGYEIKIWISKEDFDTINVDEVFEKIDEFFSENWDRHESDEPCVIGWTLSGGPTYTTQEEIDELDAWLKEINDRDS